jgi:hypothetical protein
LVVDVFILSLGHCDIFCNCDVLLDCYSFIFSKSLHDDDLVRNGELLDKSKRLRNSNLFHVGDIVAHKLGVDNNVLLPHCVCVVIAHKLGVVDDLLLPHCVCVVIAHKLGVVDDLLLPHCVCVVIAHKLGVIDDILVLDHFSFHVTDSVLHDIPNILTHLQPVLIHHSHLVSFLFLLLHCFPCVLSLLHCLFNRVSHVDVIFVLHTHSFSLPLIDRVTNLHTHNFPLPLQHCVGDLILNPHRHPLKLPPSPPHI